ncbi:MAG: glycosyltransferase family 9 protein [Planctomycetaceae bacterium]
MVSLMRRLVLKSFQSPGDILMMTAAVRDLMSAHPGQFAVDVRTSADDLWENNPYLTPLDEDGVGVEVFDMHYPLVHEANTRPLHFIHGYPLYLEERLGVRIPVKRFRGDVHLSEVERTPEFPKERYDLPDRFWIIVAGGKYDFTAKWWNPASYQQVVDHFQGKIAFVQCGEGTHWHPPLNGVVNLVGKTNLRDFVRLMYHADGVICPVTLAMHLAAAVETKPGRPRNRGCVVIAGGREPPHWEAYPHHQFISTNGALSCCQEGGCWRSRCQRVGDGDQKDRTNLCEQPVEVGTDLVIPRCMDMITAEDVIRRVTFYYEGGALEFQRSNGKTTVAPTFRSNGRPRSVADPAAPLRNADVPTRSVRGHDISVTFYHGLGDCAYFAHLIPLYAKRGHRIAVECTPDKAVLFQAAGATTIAKETAKHVHEWGYPSGATHVGQGRFWQGSKMGHNISQPPLPDIGAKADLWDEFVASRVSVEPLISKEIREEVRNWLDGLMSPVVLFHSMGNSGQQRKSLPQETTEKFYEEFLNQCDGTLVLLDWDDRVPRLESWRIRHLSDFGRTTTEHLFALMLHADLLIGVDSGPLHAARLTDIPTIGMWMPGHYPTTYTLPRTNQLNVVLEEHTRQWNRFKRIPWNIVEHPGSSFDGSRLAELCRQMLSTPRYIDVDIAADVQMRQFIQQWCRRRGHSELAKFWDRNRSFDVLFREMKRRFERPVIVETGTIRAEEDWGGAGFFTYLAGAWLHRMGGTLHSIDVTPEHCRFAKEWTQVFDGTVAVHEQDSLTFLSGFREQIDVLYLDSLDTSEPNHSQHALQEAQLALPRLGEKSLIVFDDTPWSRGQWLGKGAEAVPWLLKQGWEILYAGYQVVLSRSHGGES